MRARDPRRIFVLTHEGVGDLVFLLPTLYSLKESLPDVRIQLVVSWTQPFLASTFEGKLAEMIPFHDRGLAQVVRAVRRFKPDVYFDFDGGFRYAVAGLFSRAGRRIHAPRELAKPYAAAVHAEALPFNLAGHRVETLMALLDMLDLPRRKISFEWEAHDRCVENAASIAARYVPRGSIALVPISGHPCKDWPLESLQETIDILTRDLGRSVVLLGKDPFPGVTNAIDLGGRTDFLTDAHLVRYSGAFDLAVGVDTGMMQIAGSVSSDADGRFDKVRGNRTVSLFGPTDHRVYRPYDPTGAFNLVVTPRGKSVAMGPDGWAGDRMKRNYMREIEPREIVDAILRQLEPERASVRRAAQGRH